MIAGPLAKVMIVPNFYDLITHGFWRWICVGPQGQEQRPLVAMGLKPTFDYTEDDLLGDHFEELALDASSLRAGSLFDHFRHFGGSLWGANCPTLLLTCRPT